jgi:hypothetical protein
MLIQLAQARPASALHDLPALKLANMRKAEEHSTLVSHIMLLHIYRHALISQNYGASCFEDETFHSWLANQQKSKICICRRAWSGISIRSLGLHLCSSIVVQMLRLNILTACSNSYSFVRWHSAMCEDLLRLSLQYQTYHSQSAEH